jgi:hypothetical protein
MQPAILDALLQRGAGNAENPGGAGDGKLL